MFPTPTQQKNAWSVQYMNTAGTTFLLIVHAIMWCLSATKPELQTLTFTVQNYVQDWVSGVRCDVSIFLFLRYLKVKQDTEPFFIKLDHMHRQKLTCLS